MLCSPVCRRLLDESVLDCYGLFASVLSVLAAVARRYRRRLCERKRIARSRWKRSPSSLLQTNTEADRKHVHRPGELHQPYPAAASVLTC